MITRLSNIYWQVFYRLFRWLRDYGYFSSDLHNVYYAIMVLSITFFVNIAIVIVGVELVFGFRMIETSDISNRNVLLLLFAIMLINFLLLKFKYGFENIIHAGGRESARVERARLNLVKIYIIGSPIVFLLLAFIGTTF